MENKPRIDQIIDMATLSDETSVQAVARVAGDNDTADDEQSQRYKNFFIFQTRCRTFDNQRYFGDRELGRLIEDYFDSLL